MRKLRVVVNRTFTYLVDVEVEDATLNEQQAKMFAESEAIEQVEERNHQPADRNPEADIVSSRFIDPDDSSQTNNLDGILNTDVEGEREELGTFDYRCNNCGCSGSFTGPGIAYCENCGFPIE